MTSSLNGEKPGKPVQKAKPTFAELRAKFESEASPLKVPNAPEFLSKCAQQSARLPLASQTLYEKQQSPHASDSEPTPESAGDSGQPIGCTEYARE